MDTIARATYLSVAVLAAQLLAQSAVPPTTRVEARSLEDFRLPPKSVFDRAMPRYPNVWFFVDAGLTTSHDAAVRLVTDKLRETMRLREDFGPFDNPEGCDFEVRLEHLQPWLDRKTPALQHAHAFHMRYYYSALSRQKLDAVELKMADGGPRLFYRFAASAHYEVEHFNPNHADVESCPVCGRTGSYGHLTGNLVEVVHDPLGLELLLKGTIRDETVRFDDQRQQPVGSVLALSGVNVATLHLWRPDRRPQYPPDRHRRHHCRHTLITAYLLRRDCQSAAPGSGKASIICCGPHRRHKKPLIPQAQVPVKATDAQGFGLQLKEVQRPSSQQPYGNVAPAVVIGRPDHATDGGAEVARFARPTQ